MKFKVGRMQKLGTMETKTESNTMTNYIDEIRRQLDCGGPLKVDSCGVRVEYLYRAQFSDSYSRIYEFEDLLKLFLINVSSKLYSYKKHLEIVEIPKFVEYCIGVSTFEKHMEKEYYSYCFANHGVIHKIDIFFRNDNRKLIVLESYPIIAKDFWNLTSYDFTDDLKIQMSKLSIEEQIQMIQDMNDQKHRKIERQEAQIIQNEEQITSIRDKVQLMATDGQFQIEVQQSRMELMQNQIETQYKLIISLQVQNELQEAKNREQFITFQTQFEGNKETIRKQELLLQKHSLIITFSLICNVFLVFCSSYFFLNM